MAGIPTVTIRIAAPASGDSGDGRGVVPLIEQMWYVLAERPDPAAMPEQDDGDATIVAFSFTERQPVPPPVRAASYGFVADCERQGQPFSAGRALEPEDRKYGAPTYSRTVDISEEQFEAMQNLIYDPDGAGFKQKYHAHEGGSIAFGWKAMEVGGMNPDGYEGGV